MLKRLYAGFVRKELPNAVVVSDFCALLEVSTQPLLEIGIKSLPRTDLGPGNRHREWPSLPCPALPCTTPLHTPPTSAATLAAVCPACPGFWHQPAPVVAVAAAAAVAVAVAVAVSARRAERVALRPSTPPARHTIYARAQLGTQSPLKTLQP